MYYPLNLNKETTMKRTSITLEDPIYDAGQKIAAKRGFSTSFSAYVAWLITRDAEGKVTRESNPVISKPKAPAKVKKAAKRPAKRGK